ncbi:CPBP family intramembrane glutamic endopeptidase [Curtobacterium flaccumfaciens]|uniref:CPBP family intramembrane glutamic endopeptidase n=1 Tax=Curtobacterium flaccumfaciens TaxID=2035 RepID=UPI001BDE8056|nr:type II CAAX endopeptidase family protein [Curtobacterium flaccumfaciens]MBT1632383.1 CPBP family intramembrane metalloprotease [Curtobacterium flaccumfaciens pv. oortii]MCX2844976.1 type II CAAX endopeptidase family protein [Curtobacterium flaccumfaciens pv. oortii]
MTAPVDGRREVPRLFWIALVACVVYVLMAAGVGNLLSAVVDGENHPIADWLAGTWIPVGIMIVAGVFFARRSGWWSDIWREPAVAVGRPRRWWWLAAPVLSLVSTVILYSLVPWSEASVGIIVVVLIGALGVGVGEELFFRGILVTALRAHHSEFVVLIVSSVMFGLAHVVGFVIAGLPLGLVLFQVAFLSMDGALFYAARRANREAVGANAPARAQRRRAVPADGGPQPRGRRAPGNHRSHRDHPDRALGRDRDQRGARDTPQPPGTPHNHRRRRDRMK